MCGCGLLMHQNVSASVSSGCLRFPPLFFFLFCSLLRWADSVEMQQQQKNKSINIFDHQTEKLGAPCFVGWLIFSSSFFWCFFLLCLSSSSYSFFFFCFCFHLAVGGLCLASWAVSSDAAELRLAAEAAPGSRRRWLISSSASLRHNSSRSFSFFFSLKKQKNKTKQKQQDTESDTGNDPRTPLLIGPDGLSTNQERRGCPQEVTTRKQRQKSGRDS